MIYSSYVFIFAFLPVVVVGYFLLQNLKSPIYQRVFLILASLVFYGYNNVNYIPLIVSSVIVNYIIAIVIQKASGKSLISQRILLTVGVLFNIALLAYYKYYDFFVENLNQLIGTDFVLKNIMLPLGISFFTFQQLSFLISVYKKDEKVEKFYDYALFVTFFPQLVAGPIVTYTEIIPQFRKDSMRYFNWDNFAAGLYIFVIGMFKKVVLADTVALFVTNGFAMANPGMAVVWVSVLSYSLQVYFDFSGYSDMSIGLGKMFNIDIIPNFDSPYKSESITVFWRRWHITLGRALSEYIYKPLGGSRKGMVRTCVNLFLTFFVSGLWHGAAWTYVVWGSLFGLLMVFERLTKKWLERIPRGLRVFGTFTVYTSLFVIFLSRDFQQVAQMYRVMFDFTKFNFLQIAQLPVDGLVEFPYIVDCVYVLGLITVLLFVVFKCKNSTYMYKNFSFTRKQCVLTAVAFLVSLIFMSRGGVFIYFNF